MYGNPFTHPSRQHWGGNVQFLHETKPQPETTDQPAATLCSKGSWPEQPQLVGDDVPRQSLYSSSDFASDINLLGGIRSSPHHISTNSLHQSSSSVPRPPIRYEPQPKEPESRRRHSRSFSPGQGRDNSSGTTAVNHDKCQKNDLGVNTADKPISYTPSPPLREESGLSVVYNAWPANVEFLNADLNKGYSVPSDCDLLDEENDFWEFHFANTRPANVGFLRRDIQRREESFLLDEAMNHNIETHKYSTATNRNDMHCKSGLEYSKRSSERNEIEVSSGRRRLPRPIQTEVSLELHTAKLIYPPLLSGTKSSIRLLRLEAPAERGFHDPAFQGEIRCSLVTAQPWMDQIEYECLSYAWGNTTEMQEIYIKASEHNYLPIKVTANLHKALRRLQATHTARWLWIDAICIDQDNIAERSSQVGFMREIYSKAKGVIIWLGESNPNLDSAVYIISGLLKGFTRAIGRDANDFLGRAGLQLSPQDLHTLGTVDVGRLYGWSTRETYTTLASFFSLPWFRRVWVLQEAFAQSSITVRLGRHSLSWSSVILTGLWQSYLARSYTQYAPQRIDAGYLPELWLGLLHSRQPRGLSMLELVCRARDFQATDPRDKVFALIGLANDLGLPETRPAGLIPDYNKSKELVYCEFAQALIVHSGNLDVLATVDQFTKPDRTRNRISWMPDLDIPVATIRGLGFPRKYNASYSTTIDSSVTGHQIDEFVLSLTGYIIDTISQIVEHTITLRKDLHLCLDDMPNAVDELWHKTWAGFEHAHLVQGRANEEQLLHSFVYALTATGFASPTEFPEHPLGNIIPSHEVPSLLADFAAYWNRTDPLFRAFSRRIGGKLKNLAPMGDAEQFAVLAGKACHERRFFVTGDGRIGLCPANTRQSDKIVILYGGSVPYVLRHGSNGRWTFVGECYVDGIMFGEAKRMKEAERLFDQVFHVQ